ncbi:Regulator of nonsense transcripts 1-like protein [Diplodia seriata]|uniref:Regulator of nonsense transcripts 1-like protein n=1 Tax=Diplodia seriata TaxID=420778 RepID=A0A1S8B596_9PEZI|nr:Regulator of nonsense transcripts 1-like protein [Diplodia seriata]
MALSFWDPRALALFCDKSLFVSEEHDNNPLEEEALSVEPMFDGSIIMPQWLKDRKMDRGQDVVFKASSGWIGCVLMDSTQVLGSFKEKKVALQVKAEVLLPVLRLKIPSPEGDIIIDVDPDACELIDYNSFQVGEPERAVVADRSVEAGITPPEGENISRVRIKACRELSVRASSLPEKADTTVNMTIGGSTESLYVRERSAVHIIESSLLTSVQAMLQSVEGVEIWSVAKSNFDSWNMCLAARALSPGAPKNMWPYTQLPQVDPNAEDMFDVYRQQRNELPVPSFLKIKEDSDEWRSCSQWWSDANPRTVYPTASAFRNIYLPAILAEHRAHADMLDQIYNLGNTHEALFEFDDDMSSRVTLTIRSPSNTYLPIPRVGTMIECFLARSTDRSKENAIRGLVEGIASNGIEFFFCAQARSEHADPIIPGRHEVVVTIERADDILDMSYQAIVASMTSPNTMEGEGWFSLRKLLLGIPSGPAPCLYGHWQRNEDLWLRPEEQESREKAVIKRNRESLGTDQRLAHDSLIFGHLENSCLLIRGGPGVGKTHTICKMVASLIAMDYNVLLVAHADNTVDMLTARVVTEIDDNQMARRYFSQATLNAYGMDRSLEDVPVKSAQTEKNKAWSARLTRHDRLDNVHVVCAVVYDVPSLAKAGFRPHVVVFDEMSLFTEPDICVALTSMSASAMSVVLVGDNHQPQAPLASASMSPFHSQLALQPMERFLKNLELSAIELKTNYRQAKELGEFSNKLLGKFHMTGYSHQAKPSRLSEKVANALRTNMLPFKPRYQGQIEFFVDVRSWSRTQEHGFSITNDGGVALIVKCVEKLVNNAGISANDIGIISVYSYDAVCLRQALLKRGLPGVEVCVTARYSGRERPIIFAHSPKADEKSSTNPFGLISDKKLLLLHASRANQYAFYVGNFSHYIMALRQSNVQSMAKKFASVKLWLDHMESTGRRVTARIP